MNLLVPIGVCVIKGKLDVYEDDHVSDNYENDDFM